MQLSTSSLLLMSGVGVLISAISLLFLWFANRDIRAAGYWALAPCCFTLSMLLFAIQDVLSFSLRFTLPNFLVQGAFLIIIAGLFLACDKAVPKRLMSVYFAIFVTLHSLFTFVFPIYQWRFILGVVTVTLSSCWIIWVLYHHGRDKYRASSLLIGLSLFIMFYFSANKLFLFNSQNASSLQQDNSIESQLFVIAIFASQLLLNFAFAIMIGEYRNQKNKRYQQQLIETNHQLEQAKQAAEHHSELKSEFLANMSHEIRTPINGVIGSLELINDRELTTQQARYKTLANSSAYSLLGIINDILDFSKIESGKLTLHLEEFDIYQLIDSVAKSFAIEVTNKDLALLIDTQDLSSRYIYSDPIRIRQVLTNLISNAIKFTAKGRVQLVVALKQQDNSHWQLVADVIDTGIGIDATATDKLFKSFSQCDASTTRVFGGTGLGLTIVKSLCKMMQGDAFLVSSEKEKGAHFQFFVHVGINQQAGSKRPQFTFNEVVIYSENDLLIASISNEFRKYTISVTTAAYDVLPSNKQALILIDLSKIEYDTKRFDRYLNYCIENKLTLGVILPPNSELEAYFSDHAAVSFIWHLPVTAFDVIKLSEWDRENQTRNNKDDLCGIRVLIAEDNPVNLVITEQILANWQVDFVSAKNGKEVLAMLEQHLDAPFDVILMDCQMPEMDGYETTRIIRNGAAFSHCKTIPIIALTANAMKGDDEYCYEVGMSGYVSKPINSENLLAEIKQVITKTQ
ncbi:response regulator [Pseudoalteromonas piratica]|nr:response regulator [Pseudoalteromonas piratica]